MLDILYGVGGLMAWLLLMMAASCVQTYRQKTAARAVIMGSIPIPGGFADPDSDDEALLVVEPEVHVKNDITSWGILPARTDSGARSSIRSADHVYE
jgi:hypothetical protein